MIFSNGVYHGLEMGYGVKQGIIIITIFWTAKAELSNVTHGQFLYLWSLPCKVLFHDEYSLQNKRRKYLKLFLLYSN